MRKVVAGIATVVVLGIGGILMLTQINDDTNIQQVSANNKNILHTERTVEIGSNYPWEYFTTEKIEELQSTGEVVYLYSDAEQIEDIILKVISSRDTDGQMNIIASYLDLFIKEVSQQIDNSSYFNKLNELKQSMFDGEYEKAVTLIEEARLLRDSE